EQGAVRGDGRAPVVADDRGGLLAEGVDDGGVVGDMGEHAVGVGGGGCGGAPVAAYVDGDGPVSGGGQGGELVTPGVPGLGEAVDEEDEGAGALFDAVNP